MRYESQILLLPYLWRSFLTMQILRHLRESLISLMSRPFKDAHRDKA